MTEHPLPHGHLCYEVHNLQEYSCCIEAVKVKEYLQAKHHIEIQIPTWGLSTKVVYSNHPGYHFSKNKKSRLGES